LPISGKITDSRIYLCHADAEPAGILAISHASMTFL